MKASVSGLLCYSEVHFAFHHGCKNPEGDPYGAPSWKTARDSRFGSNVIKSFFTKKTVGIQGGYDFGDPPKTGEKKHGKEKSGSVQNDANFLDSGEATQEWKNNVLKKKVKAKVRIPCEIKLF